MQTAYKLQQFRSTGNYNSDLHDNDSKSGQHMGNFTLYLL